MSDKVIKQLERTANSLNNHISRGGGQNSQRGYQLADRYNDLRSQAIHNGNWQDFCKQRNWDTSHTAQDFFA